LNLVTFFKRGQHDFGVIIVPRDGKSTDAESIRFVARPFLDTGWLVIDFAEREVRTNTVKAERKMTALITYLRR